VGVTKEAARLPKGRGSVTLTMMTEVREKPIKWLWPGFLPSGMLTLLCGSGGTGKSTLAFSIASIVSRGGLWPDGSKCDEAGNVLIYSSEDDVARTIKPRLILAGADQSRVGTIDGIRRGDGSPLAFDPASDIDSLRDAVWELGGISLLVIDPIVNAITGDMHKANDVRRGLQSIVDFAGEMDCAVLGITHFAKNTNGKNPTERVIGSQAFSALARMVLVAAKEERSEKRVLARSKSNISLDSGGFQYHVVAENLPNSEIIATRIEWGEAMDGSSREIVGSVEFEDQDSFPSNMLRQAVSFLKTELTNGPRPARELIDKAADELGLTERTLQRAKDKLQVEAIKSGFGGGWSWRLASRHLGGNK
jgi:hypothetical protein